MIYARLRVAIAVVLMGAMPACSGLSTEVSRAIDEIAKLRKALKEESVDWRTALDRGLIALDKSSEARIREVHDDLANLATVTIQNVPQTADCTMAWYKERTLGVFDEYIRYLRSPDAQLTRRLVACDTSPKQLNFARRGAVDGVEVFGFGFRDLKGEPVGAQSSYWLDLEYEDGTRESVRKPGLVVARDPYHLHVALSGYDVKPSARTLRIMTGATEPLEIGAVPIAANRHFPLKILNETSDSSTHPHIEVTVSDDMVMIGGGCESMFDDNNPAHLMTWSYPKSSASAKNAHPNQWSCGARQHSTGVEGRIRGYALAVPREALSFDDVVVVRERSTNPSLQPKATARVESPFVLIGGGCETSALGDLLDYGPVIEASSPSGGPGWSCLGRTAPRQGPNVQLPGPIEAYAIGIKLSALQVLDQDIVGQSSEPGEHPSALATLVSKDALEEQQRGIPENAALVGGGCWSSDVGGNGVYLVKSYPFPGVGNRRGWRCVFGSHANAGTAKAHAVAIGVVPMVTLGSMRNR